MKNKQDQEPDCGKKIKCKTLIIHGEKYKTLYTKKFENRKKWQKPDKRKVMSVLPGTVIQLFAKVGAEVSDTEKMLVLEAMKMRNTYYYPISGKIKNVNVKVGDRIPKGHLVIEFE